MCIISFCRKLLTYCVFASVCCCLYVDDDEDDDDEEDEIQVEFGIYDPQPIDYHTLKMLLHNYIPTSTFHLNDFAELISEQVTVGSMIKADGSEEQPIGFATVLNMDYNKVTNCVVTFACVCCVDL